MDIVISAVASELVSRFISFVSKQYSSSTCLKQNLEELQRLLLRAHTIVEEADGRYVSNSGMLAQLRTLTEAMFRGYDVLDTCTPLEKLGDEAEEEVSGFLHTWSPLAVMTRRRTYGGDLAKSGALSLRPLKRHQVESAVRNLETTVASMAEFVVLLTGCERRMSRSPYSSYLYIDNFMFGRQVEKQQVISILTTKDDDDDPSRSTRAAITVLPIIGGCRVGKKTLVGNICSDDRIRSCYPCILHFSGDEIQKIDEEKFSICRQVRTLVTVEFASDVADEEWLKFQSLLVASTGRGSKVIIISRLEKLARFGTVSPVRIGSLSREEYRYLFKVLAFGSADPADHPRLALLGRELATVFRGSLVMLNVYASVLRSSLSVRLWTRVLDLFRAMARRNLAVFGEHPTTLLERDGSAVDITGFSLSGASFRLVLVTTAAKGGACASDDGAVLPTMSFGDIIAGAEILPDRFRLVWESRLPPYTVICANCAAEKPHHQHPVSVSPRRNKRQKLSSEVSERTGRTALVTETAAAAAPARKEEHAHQQGEGEGTLLVLRVVYNQPPAPRLPPSFPYQNPTEKPLPPPLFPSTDGSHGGGRVKEPPASHRIVSALLPGAGSGSAALTVEYSELHRQLQHSSIQIQESLHRKRAFLPCAFAFAWSGDLSGL